MATNSSNYILRSFIGQVEEYDQNWNLINIHPIPAERMISIVINNTRIFYAISYNAIYKRDSNLNILKELYFGNQFFSGICFNIVTNHILVVSNGYNYEQSELAIVDPYLTIIKNFSFPDNSSFTDIEAYNGIVYVATKNGVIWVLINEKISTSFITFCSSIQSLLIDPYGYIAVLCSTNEIYVYSPIGTYMNVALVDLVSFVLDPLDMSFDLYGNLAITGSNGV